MLDSSLIKILKSFSKTEIKEFNDMVCSPYFNKRRAVTKFWGVVHRFAPDFSSKSLERESVYKIVFPGKKYNYGTMKNLIFDLSKLAEKFIELKIYNEKAGSRSINLLEGFSGRRLKDLFKKNVRSIENTLEENKGEVDYYRNKYLLEILKQSYLIQQDIFHNNAESIKSANENLTMGYFSDIFNNNYSLMIWQYEHGGDYNNDFVKKTLAYYESSPVEMDYRVKIYYHAFMLIFAGGTWHFYELKKLLEDNINNLSVEQKYNFFLAMGNYCIKKYNEGSMEFDKHEFEIYRFMIENEIYNANNAATMGGTFYKNAAIAAIKNNEFEWALNFIEKFKLMLEPEVRENYYFHALIEYNIKLKNFEEAVKYIARIKYTDTVAKLNIKRWEIITGYELKHFEKLRNLIDSTKHFLRNEKKISPHTKYIFSNFVSIVSKIMALNEVKERKGLTRPDINILIEELSKADTSHKEWLLEKINEMISK